MATNDSTPAAIVAPLSTSNTNNIPAKITRFTLLFTFVTTDPVEKVIRFSKTKTKVELTCSNIVKVYNKHSVDLLDRLLRKPSSSSTS